MEDRSQQHLERDRSRLRKAERIQPSGIRNRHRRASAAQKEAERMTERGKEILARLTRRERELVVRLAETGSTNREIAQHFGIKEQDVKNRLRILYDKTGMDTRVK